MSRQIPIAAWDHIVVRVTDLERSLAFYEDHLGFEPFVDVEIGGEPLERILSGHAGEPVKGARARLVIGLVGGQRVELIQYFAEGDVELPPPGIGAFTLRVPDADDAYAAAVEGGAHARDASGGDRGEQAVLPHRPRRHPHRVHPAASRSVLSAFAVAPQVAASLPMVRTLALDMSRTIRLRDRGKSRRSPRRICLLARRVGPLLRLAKASSTTS